MEDHPRAIEAHPGTVKPHHGAVKPHPGAVEAHSGALKYNRAIFIFSSNTGGMSIKGYLLFGG
jgi:hypothetical protein